MIAQKEAYFTFYTGYAEFVAEFEAYLALAEAWESARVRQIRIFRAGVTTVYLCVSATRWWTLECGGDEDWLCGKVTDAYHILIRQRRKRLVVRELKSRPRPERRWQGRWLEFTSADALADYARQRINRMSGRNQSEHATQPTMS